MGDILDIYDEDDNENINWSDANKLYSEDINTYCYNKQDIMLMILELSDKDKKWILNQIKNQL